MTDSSTSPLVSASLGDMIRTVGPESQVTWLGDTRHGNLQQQLALMSPDTVRAASEGGKRYMIVEAFSNPMFEDWSRRFNAGEITPEQLHQACMTLNQPFANGAALEQWREGAYNMFVAMKQNGVQLLSVDRGQDKPMNADRDYPQFVELRNRVAAFDAETDPVRKEAIATDIQTWATSAIGSDFVKQYKDWHATVYTGELNERDAQGINASLARAGGAGVLMVWGDGHNETPNDLDEAIGKDRVKVVSVYGSRAQEQIRTQTGSVRTQVPDYLYYLGEAQGGRLDQRNDISNPERPNISSADALNGYTNNSMAGMLEGFEVKHSFTYRDESRANLSALPPGTPQGQGADPARAVSAR